MTQSIARVYRQEYCRDCGMRACLTEVVEAATRPVRVCMEGPEGETRCLGPCCHGCECAQAGDCTLLDDPEPELACYCDCHAKRLHLEGEMHWPDTPPLVIDLTLSERCQCYVCLHGVPPTLYYVPGYDGGDGHWVSNRPKDCLHYEGRVNDGRSIISSFYDNGDCRNHHLSRYFS